MATKPKAPLPRTHRILVALDASELSLAALDAAARMAAEIEAELLGVFVEDIELLNFAALPFARVIDSVTARPRTFSLPDAEREFRRLAEESRRSLARVAESAAVPWSFRAVRGRVLEEMLAAARECDLFTLGRAGGSPLSRQGRTGSLARAAARDAPASVIVMGCALRPGQTIFAMIDDAATAPRVLDSAASLAQATGGRLTVLSVAGDAKARGTLDRLAEEVAAQRHARMRLTTTERSGTPALRRAIEGATGGALVLAAASPLLADDSAEALLEQATFCVYLVR